MVRVVRAWALIKTLINTPFKTPTETWNVKKVPTHICFIVSPIDYRDKYSKSNPICTPRGNRNKMYFNFCYTYLANF